MASCRHRHIVAPKGVHASENHCIVVHEYITNGSVDDHLFSPRLDTVVRIEKRIFLDWPQRLKIALGTAKGLAYLHEVREAVLVSEESRFQLLVCTWTVAAIKGSSGRRKGAGVWALVRK
jgi:serine/threonine protein kinase